MSFLEWHHMEIMLRAPKWPAVMKVHSSVHGSPYRCCYGDISTDNGIGKTSALHLEEKTYTGILWTRSKNNSHSCFRKDSWARSREHRATKNLFGKSWKIFSKFWNQSFAFFFLHVDIRSLVVKSNLWCTVLATINQPQGSVLWYRQFECKIDLDFWAEPFSSSLN